MIKYAEHFKGRCENGGRLWWLLLWLPLERLFLLRLSTLPVHYRQAEGSRNLRRSSGVMKSIFSFPLAAFPSLAVHICSFPKQEGGWN